MIKYLFTNKQYLHIILLQLSVYLMETQETAFSQFVVMFL